MEMNKSCRSTESSVLSSLESKIDEFAETFDTKAVDNKTTEAISLWVALRNSLCGSRSETFEHDFCALFKKLYLCTARFILKGYWYTAISKNNSENCEFYKKGLLEPLNGIRDTFATQPTIVELCRSLKPLLDTSPWDLPYISEILSKDLSKSLASKSTVDTLWEKENTVLLKVRIEFLCTAKAHTQAFNLAHACYLKGFWMYEEDSNKDQPNNENIQHSNDYTKELYLQFTDIFYLLLCRIDNSTKYNDNLSVPTALEVVERLKKETAKIAPNWRAWNKAPKTIIVSISEFLTRQNRMDVDPVVLRSLFSHWIQCLKPKSDGNDDEIRPVKEVLTRINSIKSDYAYELANTILENFSTHPNAGIKFLEIYIRSLNKDMNELDSLEVVDKHDSEVTKSLKQKLSQRYLRMADVFINDKEMSFQIMLTAFSLNPVETLYNRLFETSSSDGDWSKIGVNENCLYKQINLTPALNDDLQTVIMGCRWTSLCWEKDKGELKRLCRQQLESGGPKILAKEDLTHLHIDYETYKPPPMAEPDSINDYGFEKGYEPTSLLTMLHKKRPTARSRPKPSSFYLQRNSNKTHPLKKRNLQPSNDPSRWQPPPHRHRDSGKGRQSKNRKSSRNVIPKLCIGLGSRLKLKKLTITSSEISKSVLVRPPHRVVSSTEYYRAMTDKDFFASGDYSTCWSNVISSKSLVEQGDYSLDSINEQFMTTTPVEDDFLSYLADKPMIYNRLKLSCSMQKHDVLPLVTLEREIPESFENNVASLYGMERVIEVIKETLDVLQYVYENPACSNTLSQAMTPSTVDGLTNDSLLPISSQMLPQLIKEGYDALSNQSLYPKPLSNTSTNKSRKCKPNVIKPRPKGKKNSLVLQNTTEHITRVLEVQSQALGLELSNKEAVSLASQSLGLPSIESIPSNHIISSTPGSHTEETSVLESNRMDGLLLCVALLKLKNVISVNNINGSTVADSIVETSTTSTCLELLKKVQNGLTTEHLIVTNKEAESKLDPVASDVKDKDDDKKLSAQGSNSDDILFLQKIVEGVDDRVLEVAKAIYGSFIQSYTNEKAASEEVISDEDSTVPINTREKRKKKLSEDDPEYQQDIKHRKTLRHHSPRHPPSVVKKIRGKKRGHLPIQPIEDGTNVLPSDSLPVASEEPKISLESIENHALYEEGVRFLNEQTGLMELISHEQNLVFVELNDLNDDVVWLEESISDTDEHSEDSLKWGTNEVKSTEGPRVTDTNSFVCTCKPTSSTAERKDNSIYWNPHNINPSRPVDNGLCKKHSMKDLRISLVKLSATEIAARIGKSSTNHYTRLPVIVLRDCRLTEDDNRHAKEPKSEQVSQLARVSSAHPLLIEIDCDSNSKFSIEENGDVEDSEYQDMEALGSASEQVSELAVVSSVGSETDPLSIEMDGDNVSKVSIEESMDLEDSEMKNRQEQESKSEQLSDLAGVSSEDFETNPLLTEIEFDSVSKFSTKENGDVEDSEYENMEALGSASEQVSELAAVFSEDPETDPLSIEMDGDNVSKVSIEESMDLEDSEMKNRQEQESKSEQLSEIAGVSSEDFETNPLLTEIEFDSVSKFSTKENGDVEDSEYEEMEALGSEQVSQLAAVLSVGSETDPLSIDGDNVSQVSIEESMNLEDSEVKNPQEQESKSEQVSELTAVLSEDPETDSLLTEENGDIEDSEHLQAQDSKSEQVPQLAAVSSVRSETDPLSIEVDGDNVSKVSIEEIMNLEDSEVKNPQKQESKSEQVSELTAVSSEAPETDSLLTEENGDIEDSEHLQAQDSKSEQVPQLAAVSSVGSETDSLSIEIDGDNVSKVSIEEVRLEMEIKVGRRMRKTPARYSEYYTSLGKKSGPETKEETLNMETMVECEEVKAVEYTLVKTRAPESTTVKRRRTRSSTTVKRRSTQAPVVKRTSTQAPVVTRTSTSINETMIREAIESVVSRAVKNADLHVELLSTLKTKDNRNTVNTVKLLSPATSKDKEENIPVLTPAGMIVNIDRDSSEDLMPILLPES